nr:immunoglobulin heavy chain junction region [Mus musculus]MBK4185107.1 immunoglobulin heavy chain junction region [Mus musculus]
CARLESYGSSYYFDYW